MVNGEALDTGRKKELDGSLAKERDEPYKEFKTYKNSQRSWSAEYKSRLGGETADGKRQKVEGRR